MQVLRHDASNIEAIACLGSYHFYSDQPEVSMMYLRRILQMGKLVSHIPDRCMKLVNVADATAIGLRPLQIGYLQIGYLQV